MKYTTLYYIKKLLLNYFKLYTVFLLNLNFSLIAKIEFL